MKGDRLVRARVLPVCNNAIYMVIKGLQCTFKETYSDVVLKMM